MGSEDNHHERDDAISNRNGHEHRNQSGKKHNILVKVLVVAAVVIVALVAALIIGLIAMFVHFATMPEFNFQQAIGEAWQTVESWFQPLIDQYNRVVKLIPGVQ
ncbi:MAG TPA: hypothetical protein VMR45_02495 [Patescibacteria group bacterium]|nr:hypothetical protein [Patescibacteria group bacterium]